jgi:hypothetical protein
MHIIQSVFEFFRKNFKFSALHPLIKLFSGSPGLCKNIEWIMVNNNTFPPASSDKKVGALASLPPDKRGTPGRTFFST